MTEEQKETLRFYTTNDYLLINGLLWGESRDNIEKFIKIINEDGRGVLKEAIEVGYDVRWNCSKEEGDKLYKTYLRRFPIIDCADVVEEIILRAKNDIKNMIECLDPLESKLTLYRNIKTRFIQDIKEGEILRYLGFSSCSLNPHEAENAMYGSNDCTMCEITVPAGMPAIRLDSLYDIQNESDEVILPPIEFIITKIDRDNAKICMECGELIKSELFNSALLENQKLRRGSP